MGVLRKFMRELVIPGELPENKRRKELLVPVYFGIGALCALWALLSGPPAMSAASTDVEFAAAVCNCAALVVMAVCLLSAGTYIVCTKRMNQVLCEYPAVICSVAVLLMDLSFTLRGWDTVVSLNVVVLDCLLLCECSGGATKVIVGLSVGWTLVRAVLLEENVQGDPCSDKPGRFTYDYNMEVLSWFIVLSAVLLIDFRFTRGFAMSTRHQMRLVEAAVGVTEAIAEQLSLYEVEEGRALLEGEAGARLPDGLRSALLRLLNNLDVYRPFLPEAFLDPDCAELGVADPPGVGDGGTVTVCFTDIQSSTELWSSYPQGMHTALLLHNDIMRSCARSCAGYEVKVIGDSFMLAFKTVEDGCRFALEAQEALVEAKWPSDLLQHRLCVPTAGDGGVVLWNGPRVRIGVNCGAVRVDKNPVTGRCDYFGPPVNIAARVEACVQHGGLTGVTAAVLQALTPEAMARLRAVTVLLGEKQLKGVQELVEVAVLLPERLAGRRAVFAQEPQRSESFSSMHSLSSSASKGLRQSPSMLSLPVSLTRRSAPREGLQLRPAATCATFRARADAGLQALGCSVGHMLEAVEQAADMTQGVVVGTMSAQCTVVWNGPRTCGDHYGQCLRASDFVRRSRAGIAAGACSGELLHGTVAGSRKKHATIVGGCVDLSARLAEAAEESGEAVLAAATFALYCNTLRRARRHADWRIHGGGVLVVLSLTPPAEDGWWSSVTETSEAPASIPPLRQSDPSIESPGEQEEQQRPLAHRIIVGVNMEASFVETPLRMPSITSATTTGLSG
eukprot:TRINITY_DN542_c1_g8_i1.p1 TRINITY_DN542_c1_g8~~TRINITY_DN542_c1_g8_i1.p1  ORF type:complete len:812 (+),score=248.71 TRINITY_DN542_c1_g8_i1:70-2436(+)